MSDAEAGLEHGGEHRVTPLELFFDLALVFAFTQASRLLTDDPTWRGVLHGMLVLAALWWAWNVYAWLTSATDVDDGGVRLAMLASMGAMLVLAMAVSRRSGGCTSTSPRSSRGGGSWRPAVSSGRGSREMLTATCTCR